MSEGQGRGRDQEQGEGNAGGGDQTPSSHRGGRSMAEWTTLGISLAILFGIAGLVTYLYLAGGAQPPIITAEPKLDELRHDRGAYYLPVEVINQGDETAEGVRVEAELVSESGPPETAEFTLLFLAGGERAHGTAVFSEDPSKGDLTVRAISFVTP